MRAVPSALGSQHRLVWELSAVRSAFIPRSFKLGCWHLAAPAAAPNPSSQIPAPWPWPAPRCPDRDSCLHLRPRGSAAKYKWQAGARSHIRRGEREWEERPHQPRPQIHCLAASASHLQLPACLPPGLCFSWFPVSPLSCVRYSRGLNASHGAPLVPSDLLLSRTSK